MQNKTSIPAQSYGGAVIDIPLTPILTAVGYVGNPPIAIPIAIPATDVDFCPPTGSCGVYVIYSILATGGMQVEKYGMTCQANYKLDPATNPRPQCQVSKFNRTLADKLIDALDPEGDPEAEQAVFQTSASTESPQRSQYKWSWVTQGIDKTAALLIEKAMVAGYVASKFKETGFIELPPKQGLPNFGIKNNRLTGLQRVIDFLKDFKNKIF